MPLNDIVRSELIWKGKKRDKKETQKQGEEEKNVL